MQTETRPEYIKVDKLDQVFRTKGENPFRAAIDYARNTSTTDLNADKNLQALFAFVLKDYHPLNPFDSQEMGVSPIDRIRVVGKITTSIFDQAAIFDLLAAARLANRVLVRADDRAEKQALHDYKRRKSEVMNRFPVCEDQSSPSLQAHLEVAKLIEQYIIDGKLTGVSPMPLNSR